MQLVPEWAPNIHPMFVHFPLALLFTAVLVDLLALLIRSWKWLRSAAVSLYVLGAISTLVTYFTGQWAADSVNVPAQAQTVLTEHADLALWTLWFFGIYALIRIAALAFDWKTNRQSLHFVLFLIGLGGLYLPWQTGKHGSQMVYQHGVGVAAVETARSALEAQQADSARQAIGPSMAESGSWQWEPGPQALDALNNAFTWLTGEAAQLRPTTMLSGSRKNVLALQVQDSSAFFVLDEDLHSLQADVLLNLNDFDGTFTIAHHVRGAGNYDFLEVGNGTMRLGRVQNGESSVLDEQPYEAVGWQQLRVVADKTHFRSYVGDQLVAHGHGQEAEAGSVGIRLEGTGTVLIDRIDVQSLRE